MNSLYVNVSFARSVLHRSRLLYRHWALLVCLLKEDIRKSIASHHKLILQHLAYYVELKH